MDEPKEQPKTKQAPRMNHAERIATSWQEITNHCQTQTIKAGPRRTPLAAKMHAILLNPNATKHDRFRAERWREVKTEQFEAEEMRKSEKAAAASMQAEMDAAGFGDAPPKPSRSRRIPGAKARLDQRYDDASEPPASPPDTSRGR